VLDFHRTLPGTPLERAHRLLFHTQLARVVQFEDFLGMRASVEARFPFLDHRLVDWAFRQPFHSHVHGPSRRGKVLLRRAMRHQLPDRLLDRSKAVFPHPDTTALQAALAKIAVEHRAEIRQDPLVTDLFTLPEDPAVAPLEHLWALLYLWRWHRKLTASPLQVLA
jgi:asparagine synthase (glutamine-hydrolysing)